jgi:phage shock protein PspC (stress-responsive transcriptional regulator)
MRGNILNYSEENDAGIITGPGDSRYKFSKADWKENCPVISRVNVDFVAEGDRATEIYCTDSDKLKEAIEEISRAKASEIENAELAKQEAILRKLEQDYSIKYRSSDEYIWKGVCAGIAHNTGLSIYLIRGLFIYPGIIFLSPIFYFIWSHRKQLPTKNVFSVGASKFAEKVNSIARVINIVAGKGPNGESSNTGGMAGAQRASYQATIGRNEDQRDDVSNKEASSSQVKHSSFEESPFKPTTPVAITGAVIGKISEDSFQYYEKCEACGFVRTYAPKTEKRDHWQTTMGGKFYCPTCSHLQKVEIKTV